MTETIFIAKTFLAISALKIPKMAFLQGHQEIGVHIVGFLNFFGILGESVNLG